MILHGKGDGDVVTIACHSDGTPNGLFQLTIVPDGMLAQLNGLELVGAGHVFGLLAEAQLQNFPAYQGWHR